MQVSLFSYWMFTDQAHRSRMSWKMKTFQIVLFRLSFSNIGLLVLNRILKMNDDSMSELRIGICDAMLAAKNGFRSSTWHDSCGLDRTWSTLRNTVLLSDQANFVVSRLTLVHVYLELIPKYEEYRGHRKTWENRTRSEHGSKQNGWNGSLHKKKIPLKISMMKERPGREEQVSTGRTVSITDWVKLTIRGKY